MISVALTFSDMGCGPSKDGRERHPAVDIAPETQTKHSNHTETDDALTFYSADELSLIDDQWEVHHIYIYINMNPKLCSKTR